MSGTGFAISGLLVALLCVGWVLHWGIRRRGLATRPLLLAGVVLGALPALLVLGGWARLFDLPFTRFARPLLTVPTSAAVIWVALRLLLLSSRESRLRRTAIELCAVVSALAAALSASGLEVGMPLDRLTVVVALDRSRSIDLVPGAAGRMDSELRVAELGMREEDRIATVAFGATAAVEDPARGKTRLPGAQRAEVARDGTDLALAIRQALAQIPPDSAARVVLITDGVATRGDATSAALAATALDVPIDAVPLDQGRVPNVRVVSVRMAQRAAEGEALELKVVTEASADAPVEVRVFRDGELVRRGDTQISKGEDVLYLRETAPGPGLHRYDVEVSAKTASADRSAEDNAGAAFVRVRGPSTALVLMSRAALAAPMVRALQNGAFRVDVREATGLPADVAEFGRYDLVVLGDIPAADFSPSQLDALASYVRDLGGGLLLMGGDRSLGPGGFGRTPVEEVSPVSFDMKQERRRATLAQVIAVDYSGSMGVSVGEKTKLDLANEAAVRSAELLGSGDRLGVMHVDTAVSWTVPLGPVNDKAQVEKQIRRVTVGGGGILVDLTLRAAYDALYREPTQLKHLLLFADGSDAEERAHAFSLVSNAHKRGVTTSVVALGNGSDVPALENMAKLGNGRFYLIEDATRLPAVFAQETILAARSSIHETTFVPALGQAGPVLQGIDFSRAPPLTGYVVTIPKARAQVQLIGPENDPILASWSAGIGRSAVFTSDYHDRWGQSWTGWEGAARLFAQVARDSARRMDDPHVRFEADASGGELSLRSMILDDRGRHEIFRRLRVRVAGPDGFTREVPLESVGAGSYATQLPLSRPGPYVATLVDDVTGQALATTGAALSAGEEMRPTGSDRAALSRIAEVTGGKLRDTLAGIFNDREARRYAYAPWSTWLLVVSALFLLLAVASRRLALPQRARVLPTAAKVSAAVLAENAASSAPTARPSTFSALRALKKRTNQPTPPASPSVPPRAAAPATAAGRSVVPPAAAGPLPSSSTTAAAPRSTNAGKSAAEVLLERRRGRKR